MDSLVAFTLSDQVGQRVATAVKARALAVSALIAKGESNARIAAALGVTVNVVKKDCTLLFDASGMSSRLGLAVFVVSHPALYSAAMRALVEFVIREKNDDQIAPDCGNKEVTCKTSAPLR